MMGADQSLNEKDYKWQLRNGWIPDKDYVFVSYSSLDWDKVYPCVMALRSKGINVYIDIEFMENQSSSWLKNFQDRLFRDSGCKGIITFLSINYMRSYACLVEQMANRTNRMRKHAGKLLPVFYVALEPELSTLQQMSTYIYQDEVRRESTSERVEISPPEYTVLQKFILDSCFHAFGDADSVRELLDDIHDKHDVVINMYDLIFSNNKDMPNIQLFESVEACAELLADNFTNDKNNSIKLAALDELKQETKQRLGKTAPAEQPARDLYIREANVGEMPAKEVPLGEALIGELYTRETFKAEAPVMETSASETSTRETSAVGTQADETHTQEPRMEETHTQHVRESAPQEKNVFSAYNKINSLGKRFYAKYGSLVSSDPVCKQCGTISKSGKKFCSNCGAKLN
ncbi:hypothetical protein D5278_16805 [bacterium 1XD21-13]|nr:hypothetical protein [bacterium 1XD21-13]